MEGKPLVYLASINPDTRASLSFCTKPEVACEAIEKTIVSFNLYLKFYVI